MPLISKTAILGMNCNMIMPIAIANIAPPTIGTALPKNHAGIVINRQNTIPGIMEKYLAPIIQVLPALSTLLTVFLTMQVHQVRMGNVPCNDHNLYIY